MAPIRVMLVDDSPIVRGMMQRALAADGGIDVVSMAGDGQAAIDTLRRIPADIVILDIEMPVMDGLTALPQLLATAPGVKVVIISTLTRRNAEVSLRAMQLGATDCLAKPTAEPGVAEAFYRDLIRRIHALGPGHRAAPPPAPAAPPVKRSASPRRVTALAIASSTGGPQALLHLFGALKGRRLQVPVFITQHMPQGFTTILAEHIARASGMECREAVEGETVAAGTIYIAPGDYHLLAARRGGEVVLHLDHGPQENYCRPSADPMLRSLAPIYGDGLLLAVLTGMGADGAGGAAVVAERGGTVIAQDAASCVVYGMPRAVAEAGLAQQVLPLNEIAPFLAQAMGL